MGIFSCPCVVCVFQVCVSLGSRGLLKLSQHGSYWQAWQKLGAVPEVERYWGMFFAENNALVLDGEHLFVVQYKQ